MHVCVGNVAGLPMPEPGVITGDPLQYPVWRSTFETLGWVGCFPIGIRSYLNWCLAANRPHLLQQQLYSVNRYTLKAVLVFYPGNFKLDCTALLSLWTGFCLCELWHGYWKQPHSGYHAMQRKKAMPVVHIVASMDAMRLRQDVEGWVSYSFPKLGWQKSKINGELLYCMQ